MNRRHYSHCLTLGLVLAIVFVPTLSMPLESRRTGGVSRDQIRRDQERGNVRIAAVSRRHGHSL